MKWWAVLFVALITNPNARASDLNPICHQLYEMFQMPDLTYEDVGKIADHMHKNNCWPAMQASTSPLQATGGLPSCEALSEQLVSSTTNVRGVFEVRPLTQEDCGEIGGMCTQFPEHWAGDPKCTREGAASVIPIPGTERNTHGWNPTIRAWVPTRTAEYLTLSQCDLLVSNPARVPAQIPDFPHRPVNCRGKIIYNKGTRSGFYLYLEQYVDGQQHVGGINIKRW